MVIMDNYCSQTNLEELWLKIDHLHMSYLEMEESPEKIEHRAKLEACIEEFLCVASHEDKFVIPETDAVFYRSAMSKKHFSGYKAATGWNAIQMYAGNLLSQPWRKEYYQIKTYCGFYKHQVEANLMGAEKMFEVMGYSNAGNGVLTLDGPICPDRVATVSRDCLVAYVECQILKHIWEEVSQLFSYISWMDVLEFRRRHICDPDQGVKALKYACNQRQYHDSDMNPHSFEMLRAKYPMNLPRNHLSMPNNHSYNHMPAAPQSAPAHYMCMNGCCPHMYPTCHYAPSAHGSLLKHSPPAQIPPNGFYYPNNYSTVPSSYSYPVPTAQLIELESHNGYDAVDGPSVSSRLKRPMLQSSEPKELHGRNGEQCRNGIGKETYEDWDYVYRNLESQGYSKDLGERGDILSSATGTSKQRKSKESKKQKLTDLDEAVNKLTVSDRPLKVNDSYEDVKAKTSERVNHSTVKERRHSQSSSYDNVSPKDNSNLVKTLTKASDTHSRSLSKDGTQPETSKINSKINNVDIHEIKIATPEIGSEIVIEDVVFENCSEVPCPVYRGIPTVINFTLDTVPVLTQMYVEAYVNMFGQKFYDIDVAPTDTCILDCPLTHELKDAVFKLTAEFGSTLISRPATLFINATYIDDARNIFKPGLCVKIDVDIY